MISAVSHFLRSVRDHFLLFEERNNESLKKIKKTGIQVFGPIIGAAGTTATGLGIWVTVSGEITDSLWKDIAVAVILGGIIVFSLYMLLGAYFLWEYLRYDFDQPFNPMYYKN